MGRPHRDRSIAWATRDAAVVVIGVAILTACGGASPPEAAESEELRPCDPFIEERAVEVPGDQRIAATCGDGRAGEHVVSCLERCHVSCRGHDGCSTECIRADEACDGADLRGETCASVGFGRGTLACRAGCAVHDVSECSACLSPACRELAIAPPLAPVDDVRLVARGRAVRAFWSAEIDGDPHLVTAAIGPGPSLEGDPVDLGLEATRDVIATSTSWITVVAEEGALVIRTLDPRGRVAGAPLGLPAQYSGLEVLSVPSLDGALVSAGEHGSIPTHLVLLDRRGAIRALPRGAVHAISGRDRIAIAPLPVAPAPIAIAGGEAVAVEPRAGDRLAAWIHVADTCVGGDWCWSGAALLRDGAVLLPHAGAVVGDPPSAIVAVAGEPRISFAPEWDTIDGARFALPAAMNGGDRAPFAPVVPSESIVRARDLRAALFDPDGDGPEAGRFVLGRAEDGGRAP